MNFDKLCEDVMNIDHRIRFVTVLSKYGERLAGGYRSGTSSLLNPDEVRMALFYAGQRWDTRKNLSHRLGKPKYSMAEYEYLKQITIPVDEKNLLLLSTEPSADHTKIISSLLNLIKNSV